MKKKEKNSALPRDEYAVALEAASKGYVRTVILSCCLVAVGITVAVFAWISLGLGICIAAVLLYMLLTKRIFRRRLGLAVRSESGAVSVTHVFPDGKATVRIPERLMGIPVRALEDGAFSDIGSEAVEEVYLPSSLIYIGENAFDSCTSLRRIVFGFDVAVLGDIECNCDLSRYELAFAQKEDGISTASEDASDDITAEGEDEE